MCCSKARRGRVTRILLNLCVSLIILLVILYIAQQFASSRVGCRVSNIFRYYLVLVSLFWNAVEAHNMYRMLVVIFDKGHQSRFVLKAAIVAWGLSQSLGEPLNFNDKSQRSFKGVCAVSIPVRQPYSLSYFNCDLSRVSTLYQLMENVGLNLYCYDIVLGRHPFLGSPQSPPASTSVPPLVWMLENRDYHRCSWQDMWWLCKKNWSEMFTILCTVKFSCCWHILICLIAWFRLTTMLIMY